MLNLKGKEKQLQPIMILYCNNKNVSHPNEIYEILTQLTFDIDLSVLPKSLPFFRVLKLISPVHE